MFRRKPNTLDSSSLDPELRGGDLRFRRDRHRLHRVSAEYMAAIRGRLRPNSISRYEHALHNIAVGFGPLHVRELTPDNITAFVKQRTREIAPASVTGEYRILRDLLRWCVRHKIIKDDPSALINYRDLNIKRMQWRIRWLSAAELAAVMKATERRPFMHDAIVFAAGTGLRQAAQFSLTMDSVSVERREIYLKSGDNKNARRMFVIPMNDEVVAVVKRRIAYIEQAKHAKRGWFIFGYIDRTTGGLQPYSKAGVRARWLEVRDEAKLADFRWHDFRHHRAADLAQSGVDLLPLRDLMGHASIRTTLRYAALQTRNLHDIVNKHSRDKGARRGRKTAPH